MTQTQFKITLPQDLRRRLELEAAINSHSIAEEIRRRLEQSFEVDELDALNLARGLRTLIRFMGGTKPKVQ